MNYELDTILSKIKGGFICTLGGKRQRFVSKEDFLESNFDKNCSVDSIEIQEGILVLYLSQWKIPRAEQWDDVEQSFF